MTPDGSVSMMPQNVSISDGQSVTFMCVVDLAGSYVVQWSHNGEVLPGENRSLLTVSDVTAAQGGTYTCLVVNEVGSGMDKGRLYGNYDENHESCIPLSSKIHYMHLQYIHMYLLVICFLSLH